MKLDDFERKILISGLGIIVLILIFYYIHEKSKVREGAFFTIAGFSIPLPDFMPNLNIGSVPDFIKSAITSIRQSAQTAAVGEEVGVVGAAEMAQQQGIFGAKVAMDVATKISQKATAAASHAKTAIRQEVIARKQKIFDLANKLKEKILDKRKQLIKDYKEKTKEVKTFRRFLKIGYRLSRIFSKIGRWALRTVAIIITRIANLKSCFIWYALEIIGWILYLPMEFFVWFFCLQTLEKNFFDMMKEFDCFFNSLMGFHIFYYSDYIRKKCFYPHLPPFPYSSAGGLFTKKGMMNLMKEIFLPPNPIDMARHVQQGLLEYKKDLLATFNKPPNFDIKAIWAEAMDLINLESPDNVEQSGSVPIDNSNEELNNGILSTTYDEEPPIAGGTGLSDADLELPPAPAPAPATTTSSEDTPMAPTDAAPVDDTPIVPTANAADYSDTYDYNN